ncbi:MarR family winged helix-turn-helix transcriptional regulator [Methylobacterium oryzihabitans]|uniref:MarR family transcriptional regulator n=1 Tax=Methylobacterium oryzihabitans TaxID=2499852 RepID=A0A3S2YNU5_9HYPH|nr:MarR family transcriptional regulator [Methylobacterium oryzihabitans]RVU15485.1 MarR family transcriptional regulator [Methylobacterium oryzihabitans]
MKSLRTPPPAPETPRDTAPESWHGYRVEDQIGYLIRRAHQRASSIFDSVMREFGVTPVQFTALAKLHDGGPTSQNQLGRLVGIDPATMYGVAGRLTRRGYVRATDDPGDARLVLLDLTPEGRAVVEAMKARGGEVTARTLAPLSADEAALLVRLIARLG